MIQQVYVKLSGWKNRMQCPLQADFNWPSKCLSVLDFTLIVLYRHKVVTALGFFQIPHIINLKLQRQQAGILPLRFSPTSPISQVQQQVMRLVKRTGIIVPCLVIPIWEIERIIIKKNPFCFSLLILIIPSLSRQELPYGTILVFISTNS